MYEFVGYLASALVAFSMLMSSLWSLRWVNLAGSIAFTVYGCLLALWPVALTNGFIALINIYYLSQLARKRDAFSLVPLAGPDDPWLTEFLKVYGDDIRRFEPGFNPAATTATATTPDGMENEHASMKGVFILRNAVPAGLFLWEPVSEFEAKIRLDYVAPMWRDFRNADFLYEQRASFLRQQGIWKLTANPQVATQEDYLKRFGFEETGPGTKQFQLSLDKTD